MLLYTFYYIVCSFERDGAWFTEQSGLSPFDLEIAFIFHFYNFTLFFSLFKLTQLYLMGSVQRGTCLVNIQSVVYTNSSIIDLCCKGAISNMLSCSYSVSINIKSCANDFALVVWILCYNDKLLQSFSYTDNWQISVCYSVLNVSLKTVVYLDDNKFQEMTAQFSVLH